MANLGLRAIEREREIRAAVGVWEDKFRKGAEARDGLGGELLWHPRLGTWGHFHEWQTDGGITRYWNSFGTVLERPRANIIVEINPPGRGINRQTQGVIARAADGSRWLLHKGRMSIPGAHIREEQFDKASTKVRVPVVFSDGTTLRCHVVACLDREAEVLQRDVAAFVAECRRVRLYHAEGPEAARQEAEVELAEELTGTFIVPAQGPRVAERVHGDVWHALVRELNALGARHTNSRVGRWGPDLRTLGVAPVLFEIKVTLSAADLQRAVGQLLLYERLLKREHRKVLVFPEGLKGAPIVAAEELDLTVLEFRRDARAVIFNPDNLRRLVH